MTPETLIQELQKLEVKAGHSACTDKFDIAMYWTGYGAGIRMAIRLALRMSKETTNETP